MSLAENVHVHEVNKFGSRAERWWDPTGDFKTLHAVNPLRLGFISRHIELTGKQVLDVGCGGGILSESMAKQGARVTGIDLSAQLIDIAELHGLESGIQAEYETVSVEAFAERHPAQFDCVTCMELLEHVPKPDSVVEACARLVKPGGKVFFSTLNRHPKAYLLAILGAEYLLKMIPKGTHDYQTFIKPSELAAMARVAGLEIDEMTGVDYNPLGQSFFLTRDLRVNYIAVCSRVR